MENFKQFKICFAVSSIAVVLTHAVVFEYRDYFANNIQNIIFLMFAIPSISISLWILSYVIQAFIYKNIVERSKLYIDLRKKKLIPSIIAQDKIILPAADVTRKTDEISNNDDVLVLTDKQRIHLIKLLKYPKELENALKNVQTEL